MPDNEICFISTVHRANDTRIYFKEILSLANAGYKINYIVKYAQITEKHPNVNFIFLPDLNGLKGRIRLNFKALIYGVRCHAKIYHLHDPELILLGLILKLFFNRKVVFDIHEIHYDEIKYKPYLPQWLAQVISLFYKILENVATRIFDFNILAEIEYQKFFPLKKFAVVQNLIPEKYILSNSPKKIDKEHIKLIYLGSISKIRGVFEIVELAYRIVDQKIINFKIEIIGPFHPPELENEFFQKLDQLKLRNVIQYLGKLPYPDAIERLRQNDVGLIFLHPIINNLTIMPTKLFEYMGNGLVVLMSNFPNWEKFNHKYDCGLTVDIFNLDSELKRIVDFLADHEKLNKIKQRNIALIRENFTWEREEKKLLSIYSHLFLNNY